MPVVGREKMRVVVQQTDVKDCPAPDAFAQVRAVGVDSYQCWDWAVERVRLWWHLGRWQAMNRIDGYLVGINGMICLRIIILLVQIGFTTCSWYRQVVHQDKDKGLFDSFAIVCDMCNASTWELPCFWTSADPPKKQPVDLPELAPLFFHLKRSLQNTTI